MSVPTIEVPVLIVGGGPVGLAAAAELGRLGVKCILVERRDGTIGHPKMNQVSVRTMEICRRWGISDKIRRLSIPEDFPRTFTFVTAIANGYELGRFEFPARKDVVLRNSPEAVQRCSQLWFDPALRDFAASFSNVDIRYHTNLDEVSQDESGVHCRVTTLDSNKTYYIRASYLVACDGINSSVRRSCNISMQGEEAISFNINIFFRSRAHDVLFAKGRAVMQWIFGEDGLWADLVSIDGNELWRCAVMRLPLGTEVDDVAASEFLRKAAGQDFDFEIISILPWTRKRALAERFSEGRIFLAGDAVHQMSPTGGFGMNTGIAEAVDVSWKLAGRLQGWGGIGLLASYDNERRPVAHQFVEEGTRNFKQFLKLPVGSSVLRDDEEGTNFRNVWHQTLHDLQMGREYDSDGLVLGYRYDNSNVIAYDGTAEPPLDVMHYQPTTRPGHRAPHIFLADGRSILDLFGHGFTLLVFQNAPSQGLQLDLAARRKGVPLQVEVIQDHAAGALYERRYVLVRPDGHVAWRGDEEPADCDAMLDCIRGMLT